MKSNDSNAAHAAKVNIAETVQGCKIAGKVLLGKKQSVIFGMKWKVNMNTAIIKFTATAELNLDSDTFPKGMTKEQKMAYWIAGAKEEPMLALACLKQVEWEVEGELK